MIVAEPALVELPGKSRLIFDMDRLLTQQAPGTENYGGETSLTMLWVHQYRTIRENADLPDVYDLAASAQTVENQAR